MVYYNGLNWESLLKKRVPDVFIACRQLKKDGFRRIRPFIMPRAAAGIFNYLYNGP